MKPMTLRIISTRNTGLQVRKRLFRMSLSIQSMRVMWDRRISLRFVFCLDVVHSVILENVLIRRRSSVMGVFESFALSLKMSRMR